MGGARAVGVRGERSGSTSIAGQHRVHVADVARARRLLLGHQLLVGLLAGTRLDRLAARCVAGSRPFGGATTSIVGGDQVGQRRDAAS